MVLTGRHHREHRRSQMRRTAFSPCDLEPAEDGGARIIGVSVESSYVGRVQLVCVPVRPQLSRDMKHHVQVGDTQNHILEARKHALGAHIAISTETREWAARRGSSATNTDREDVLVKLLPEV